jgi:hypothetical protein
VKKRSGTASTRAVLGDRSPPHDEKLEKLERRYLRVAAKLAQKVFQNEVRIEKYTPYLNSPNGWLPQVESRIRDSVVPQRSEEQPSCEWLAQDAANAAISFFRQGADLLPAEPHIYGTENGDLVAEFETPTSTMTGVVSDTKTILFGYLLAAPHEPLQAVIARGSNHYRDDLKSFTKKLSPRPHGKMESTKG